MMNSMVRSNDDKNDKNNAFSPRGPMDENHNPKNYENSACPLRDSHYKLKLLQQQLLQQQDVVVEVSASSSSSSSPLREENCHSLKCSNDDDVSSSITAMASYSSPLMVLAAAAAATETMDPSSSSLLHYAIPTTTTMNTFENSTNNSSDPINNNNYYYYSSNKCTIAISPFGCTTSFENERSASMSMTSASPPYFPYLRHGNTYSPLNSTAPAARLDCLAAVSSHARDAATAAATDTPCRRRRRSTESMLLDEQKCLLAMSAVQPYAHPLFASSTTGNQHSKMPFTTEEKALLMTIVAQHGNGPKNWIDIAKVYFPGKSVLQVKNCWHNAHKRKKYQGRAPSSRSITPVPPPKPVSRQHIPAPFLVQESATTTTPSTVTRSRSRAMAQNAANVPNTAMTTAPRLFQPPFSNIKSHSSSTAPPVTRVAHVVTAVSTNATSSTGGRSRLLSRDIAQKSNMVVSTSRKRSHFVVRWSMREDNILKQAFEMEGPTWEEIATKYFGNTRSDEQCKNRWTKHLDPKIKIGEWTPDEDAIISRGKAQGMSYTDIASELPGRIAESVRNRYKNHLDPTLNKTKFTEEEKTTIMRVAAQYGEPKNWALVAQHVPGRSVLQIKNYWHNTTKRSGGVVQKAKKKTKTKDRQVGGGRARSAPLGSLSAAKSNKTKRTSSSSSSSSSIDNDSI